MRVLGIPEVLCGVALAAGVQSQAQSSSVSSTTDARCVVFVCEHESRNSLTAASYFNRRAQAKGLGVRAIARGVNPGPSVLLPVCDGLDAAGFYVSGYVPQLLDVSDIEVAILIVSFDEDISHAAARRTRYLRWDNLPAVLSGYAGGNDAIVKQVDRLVREVAYGRHREQ